MKLAEKTETQTLRSALRSGGLPPFTNHSVTERVPTEYVLVI